MNEIKINVVEVKQEDIKVNDDILGFDVQLHGWNGNGETEGQNFTTSYDKMDIESCDEMIQKFYDAVRANKHKFIAITITYHFKGKGIMGVRCKDVMYWSNEYEGVKHIDEDELRTMVKDTGLNAIWAFDEDQYRICSECGDVMQQGYYDGNYYCSDDCLHKTYTPEEWTKAYEESEKNGGDDCYWTQWVDYIDVLPIKEA